MAAAQITQLGASAARADGPLFAGQYRFYFDGTYSVLSAQCSVFSTHSQRTSAKPAPPTTRTPPVPPAPPAVPALLAPLPQITHTTRTAHTARTILATVTTIKNLITGGTPDHRGGLFHLSY